MAASRPKDSRDPLAAAGGDPHLSVHALSEFVFCPRAGLCIHEQEGVYEERERRADTSYIPMYFQDSLQRQMKAQLIRIYSLLFSMFIGAGICGILFWYGFPWLIALAAAAGVVLLCLAGMIMPVYQVYVASRLLKVWRAAHENLPDPDSTKTQDVMWCNILAGPVSVREPQEAYTFERWRIGGRPWRILQIGDLRIPVFLHKTPWQGLFPQHFVRMTAYCRLIEECEGFRSPYGIVLQAGTYDGITVPSSPRTRETLQKELSRARRHVVDAEEMNTFPPRGHRGNVCNNCPYGRPEPVRLSMPDCGRFCANNRKKLPAGHFS